MKNNLKLSFIVLVCALSLSACGFFSGPKTVTPTDSAMVDSLPVDSIIKDTTAAKSIKTEADSVRQSN